MEHLSAYQHRQGNNPLSQLFILYLLSICNNMAASFIGHRDHILKLGTSVMVVKTDCRTAHQSLCSLEALSTIFVFNVGLLWAYLLAIIML